MIFTRKIEGVTEEEAKALTTVASIIDNLACEAGASDFLIEIFAQNSTCDWVSMMELEDKTDQETFLSDLTNFLQALALQK